MAGLRRLAMNTNVPPSALRSFFTVSLSKPRSVFLASEPTKTTTDLDKHLFMNPTKILQFNV